MTKRLLTIPSAALLAAGVAACGSSSKAPGIVLAPSAGATVAAATPASTTPTTPTTTTPTVTAKTPTSGPLATQPKITVPKGAPPKTLQTTDLVKGTGKTATSNSTVAVDYVGEFYKTGKIFDDHTWTTKQPFTAELGPTPDIIPGWVKGIPGMKIGGRRELIIPPSLAYGARGGNGIPANSTLIFVIDLLATS
ncbi:MAG TPA: FKBP-type peptidyl-prolyl cis-trans isomerase [Solirubrobacteraceae bacterium]|nr:FKBP-type peptidyl-prolyl cis-trans isomerase [Solirubrobacteraceae bacterium]